MFNRFYLPISATIPKLPILVSNQSRLSYAALQYSTTKSYCTATKTATAEERPTEVDPSLSREQIAELLKKHQVVVGHSSPVRREFIRDKPLTTEDLKGIDIVVYHRKPGNTLCFDFLKGYQRI